MVQQIEINGIAVRMKFGMHFAENFTSDVSGSVKEDGTLTIGNSKFVSLLIWFGYLNYCEVKDEPVQIKRSDVYEWVEDVYAEDNKEHQQSVVDIIAQYNKSSFAKEAAKILAESEKKRLTGQTLEVSPSGLSG